jgi:hypothetical protein
MYLGIANQINVYTLEVRLPSSGPSDFGHARNQFHFSLHLHPSTVQNSIIIVIVLDCTWRVVISFIISFILLLLFLDSKGSLKRHSEDCLLSQGTIPCARHEEQGK